MLARIRLSIRCATSFRALPLLLLGCLLVASTFPIGAAVADDSNDAELALQGEYVGQILTPEGPRMLGTQVIALGDGKFHARCYFGGLPGAGWDGGPPREADGELKDGAAVFHQEEYEAKVSQGTLAIIGPFNLKLGEIEKIERKSPTLGATPPAGATVLFADSSASAGAATNDFEPGRVTSDGLLPAGQTSKLKFQSATIHVEFQTPFMPAARGQGRGNSGCYLQGRYEVQVLDSFGLKPENNECGGIYSIRAPSVNMCFPPLSWQTYDIDFTAAKYENDKKLKNAVMTVRHNGVVVQQDTELSHATTAAPVAEGPSPGPLYLQDHGNPVRYRNVWIVIKD